MARAMTGLGFGWGFCAFYLAAALTRLPLPWYLPLEHRWAFGTTVTGIAMGYFGRLAGALLLGLSGALAARALAPRATPRWATAGGLGLLALLALNVAAQLALASGTLPAS